MMKIIKLIKYHLNVYFKGTEFIMPFIFTFIFLSFLYSMKPLDVMSGFLLTGIYIFLLMVWIGISTAQQEDEVMEQILLFKMNSPFSYYFGKLIFLILIAMLFTLLCILLPILQNIINGSSMFNRDLLPSDIISSLFIISGSAICGAFGGNFFHPRVMKNRQLAYFLLIFTCILIIVKPVIVREIPVSEYVLWILPSIMYPSEIFANVEYFNILQSFKIFLLLIMYGGTYGTLKSILCYKYGF